MSVGEEQTECPLCMEPLELDDINFFPCTCGYQICRFCWHRIRTDENGLCPACRKQYPEDPAEFKPLTEDELQRIKKERRQKDLQRKQKAAENRKHLANVRVVQKNLVFVVGLSQRLAEPEVLKKHEYFGKFGKIHKVVINQSTSYAGAQVKGPSASAYVTYLRPEDALRAIQAVNNIYVDGRTLKASLGTTKYCSHFLRGAQCPKPDCMYLHELGEEAASFTKEEMQQGKHQEYEQKLYEQYMNSQNLTHQVAVPKQQQSTHTAPQPSSSPPQPQTQQSRKKNGSPTTIQNQQQLPPGQPHQPSHNFHPQSVGKDGWPSLQGGNGRPERLTNGNKAHHLGMAGVASHKPETQNAQNRAPGHHRQNGSQQNEEIVNRIQENNSSLHHNRGGNPSPPQNTDPSHTRQQQNGQTTTTSQQPRPNQMANVTRKSFLESPTDHMSLFSSSSGFPTNRNPKPPVPATHPAVDSIHPPEIPDTIPVSSTTDWQAAFGFKPASLVPPPGTNSLDSHDDDLGFDPWDESSKALADLIEKEGGAQPYTGLPGGSKIMPLMQMSVNPPGLHQHNYHDVLSDIDKEFVPNSQEGGTFQMKDWQEGLRALLPNINISFGAPHLNPNNSSPAPLHPQTAHSMPQKSWNNSTGSSTQSSDLTWDPAIVTSGHHINTDHSSSSSSATDEQPPHWMASLQQLTDESSNHRLPFVNQFQLRSTPSWPPQTQHPPPGFHTQTAGIRSPTQMAETQKLAEGLQ